MRSAVSLRRPTRTMFVTSNTSESSSPDNSDHSTSSTIDSLHHHAPKQQHHDDLWYDTKGRAAQRTNDAMVYLDGATVYTCGHCRTHLTSHDDIISKSFHGRHGRAYLFGQCVNITLGPSEDRRLITGLHTVCDISCKRCRTIVGWTYLKAYEMSQKYKEGKFIIEKIHLHLEESSYYDVEPPAGEHVDRWRRRSMSWGDSLHDNAEPMVVEYSVNDEED